jgi:hypothetical protein
LLQGLVVIGQYLKQCRLLRRFGLGGPPLGVVVVVFPIVPDLVSNLDVGKVGPVLGVDYLRYLMGVLALEVEL